MPAFILFSSMLEWGGAFLDWSDFLTRKIKEMRKVWLRWVSGLKTVYYQNRVFHEIQGVISSSYTVRFPVPGSSTVPIKPAFAEMRHSSIFLSSKSTVFKFPTITEIKLMLFSRAKRSARPSADRSWSNLHINQQFLSRGIFQCIRRHLSESQHLHVSHFVLDIFQ